MPFFSTIGAGSSRSFGSRRPLQYVLRQTYTASTTYAVPAGVDKIAVFVVGAGQKSQASRTRFCGGTANAGAESGGAASAAVMFKDLTVTPGTNYAVTVAAAGTDHSDSSFSTLASAGATWSSSVAGAVGASAIPGGSGGSTGPSGGGNGTPGSNGTSSTPMIIDMFSVATYGGSGGGGGGGGYSITGGASQSGGGGGTAGTGGGAGGSGGSSSPTGFSFGGFGGGVSTHGGGGGGNGNPGGNQAYSGSCVGSTTTTVIATGGVVRVYELR